jgi:hypothetical protein
VPRRSPLHDGKRAIAAAAPDRDAEHVDLENRELHALRCADLLSRLLFRADRIAVAIPNRKV